MHTHGAASCRFATRPVLRTRPGHPNELISMPLTLTLKQPTSIPIEVDSIRLEVVREQSPDQIKTTLVQYGNKPSELGEFFDVSGSAADDEHLVWVGDCSKVKLIGAGLQSGISRGKWTASPRKISRAGEKFCFIGIHVQYLFLNFLSHPRNHD